MSEAMPEPVNLAKLRLRFDDDAALLAEIFRVFVNEVPARRAGIEAALAGGDLTQLTRIAHSLKGVAGTLIAEPLRQAAYDLEMAARGGDAAAANRIVPVVLDRLETTAAFVGKFL